MIQLQNKYLQTIKVIPLLGKTNDINFYMRPHLCDFDNVIDIFPTARTISAGHWNIICHIDSFHHTSQALATHLPTIHRDILLIAFPFSTTLDFRIRNKGPVSPSHQYYLTTYLH